MLETYNFPIICLCCTVFQNGPSELFQKSDNLTASRPFVGKTLPVDRNDDNILMELRLPVLISLENINIFKQPISSKLAIILLEITNSGTKKRLSQLGTH